MTEVNTQPSLLPEKPLKGKFRRLPLEPFKAMDLPGPEPTKRFIDSVRAVGCVFQPIAVFECGEAFRVGAGIRRIKASIEVGLKDIPAMVFEDEEDMRHAITLIENTQRSSNPLAEIVSIDALIRSGYPPEVIARDLRLPIKQVRRRLALHNLIPDLWSALFTRRISVAIGQAACKLPKVYQEKLAAILFEKHRIRSQDVASVKDSRRQAAMDAIPKSILGSQEQTRGMSGQDYELLQVYRQRRAVDGGPGRVWDAAEHLRLELEIMRLEGLLSPKAPEPTIITVAEPEQTPDPVVDSNAAFDALVLRAEIIVRKSGKVSTTELQRELHASYALAVNLIDELEKRGVVGPANGPEPRKVLPDIPF